MFRYDSDITERIAETPKWWDENGAPRYMEFEPRRAANQRRSNFEPRPVAWPAGPRHGVIFSVFGTRRRCQQP